MKVSEPRAVLNALPDRFDNTEICVISGYNGLEHVKTIELDARRARADAFPHLRPERLERKIQIRGGSNWTHVPDQWQLVGPWPSELADVGLNEEPD